MFNIFFLCGNGHESLCIGVAYDINEAREIIREDLKKSKLKIVHTTKNLRSDVYTEVHVTDHPSCFYKIESWSPSDWPDDDAG